MGRETCKKKNLIWYWKESRGEHAIVKEAMLGGKSLGYLMRIAGSEDGWRDESKSEAFQSKSEEYKFS